MTFTDFCLQDWYSVAKIVAEQASLEYSEKHGLNVVTLCPPLVFGPLLQPTVNTSSKFLIYVINGNADLCPSVLFHCLKFTLINIMFNLASWFNPSLSTI